MFGRRVVFGEGWLLLIEMWLDPICFTITFLAHEFLVCFIFFYEITLNMDFEIPTLFWLIESEQRKNLRQACNHADVWLELLKKSFEIYYSKYLTYFRV